MVPDKTWTAEAGDQASIAVASPAASSFLDFSEYAKCEQANDQLGKSKLVESKRVVALPKGTSILVLKSFRPKPVYRIREVTPGSGNSTDFANDILRAALAGPGKKYPLEVRILDGPLKGEKVFLDEDAAVKLVPVKRPDGFSVCSGAGKRRRIREHSFSRPDLAKLKRTAGQSIAAAMIAEGRKFDRRGDVAGAVNHLWFAIQQDRDAPEAAEAAKLLRAMGFTKTVTGRYEVDLARTPKVKP
ncbi:MAG: hypothetical protein P4L84_11260 [Isosphaeraceae bacterium]|nr:hypothetical protein [Isosphaeraceae bacterium]